MITTILQAYGLMALFYLAVLILSPSIVVTYYMGRHVVTSDYDPNQLITGVCCVICALVWDALLFIAAYVLLLTVLIDFDSIGST